MEGMFGGPLRLATAMVVLSAICLSCGGQKNMSGDTQTKKAPAVTPAAGVQAVAPPVTTGNLADGAGPQGPSTGDTGAASGNWPPTKVITDLVTLEFCKMEAARITGDNSVFVTCFLKYVSNGNKITAQDCGCSQQTTKTTTNTTDGSVTKTTTTTPVSGTQTATATSTASSTATSTSTSAGSSTSTATATAH